MEMRVNGASIYYEMRGSGHPLILISGYTRDHTLWTPVLEALAARFQVLRFDNRGVGRTQDEGQPLSASLMAEDVRALAKALGLQKPHIIGQSMGGTVAQKLAAAYPDEIGKLVLLATSPKWRQAMLLGLRSNLSLRQRGVDPEVIFKSTIAWVFGENFLQNPSKVAMLKKAILENPYPQSLRDQERQMEILEKFDGREDLKKIKAPTLVAYGKEDLLSLPFESEYLAQQIPHARLEAFESAHGVIAEDTENLSQSLLRFLKN